MLIQPRLFSRAYIPIRPVIVMPREVQRIRRVEARAVTLARKLRLEIFQALQFPLIWIEGGGESEDRASVEEVAVTPEEIVKLASVLIEESLRVLSARNNPAEKEHILDWIFESDIVDSIVVQGPYGPRTRVIYASETPFAFAFCCNVAGHDPDRYRDYIRRLVPEVGQRYIAHARQAEPCLEEVRYRAPIL
jgi:hypothetical protein